MSLSSQLAKFKKESADTAARNISHSRPAPAPRVSTPTPQVSAVKRDHNTAFAPRSDLFSQVNNARQYLRNNFPAVKKFADVWSYLSVPVDQVHTKPYVQQALENDAHVEYIPKSENGGIAGFKYKPTHPVTNADELKDYLSRQDTAAGIPVKELKDGWPDCVSAINQLENEKAVLVLRHKKDGIPKTVWMDMPAYHLPIDQDFREFWLKTKLPGSENEIRNELEKAGITPTSQVKEVKKQNVGKKERKRPNRRGGKTTNTHMLGILKDYSSRK